MPVVYHESLRFAMVLMVIDCAPKPPQKRILDIATGDVTGVVWVVDWGRTAIVRSSWLSSTDRG